MTTIAEIEAALECDRIAGIESIDPSEAADWLRFLLDEIERLQPPWISVYERLPDWCENVWVIDTAKIQFVDYRTRPVSREYSNGFTEACGRRITHWMPLPDPPESKP